MLCSAVCYTASSWRASAQFVFDILRSYFYCPWLIIRRCLLEESSVLLPEIKPRPTNCGSLWCERAFIRIAVLQQSGGSQSRCPRVGGPGRWEGSSKVVTTRRKPCQLGTPGRIEFQFSHLTSLQLGSLPKHVNAWVQTLPSASQLTLIPLLATHAKFGEQLLTRCP